MSKQDPTIHDANKVYEKYAKPLEQKHKNQYVVVTPKGETIFGSTLMESVELARKISDANNFIFKVGDKVLGKLR